MLSMDSVKVNMLLSILQRMSSVMLLNADTELRLLVSSIFSMKEVYDIFSFLVFSFQIKIKSFDILFYS